MKTKKPHAGTQGKGVVEHVQGWMQCSTEWDECQRVYRAMAAGVVIVWVTGWLI